MPRLVSSLDPPTVASLLTLHTPLFQLLRFSCTTHTFSLSYIPVSFLSLLLARASANTQTNESAGVFFSSLHSSRPLPLENTSSLHLSRSDGTKTRFLGTCAPLLCLAPAEGREKRSAGAERRNNDDKDTHGNGGGSTHQGRSMPSLFPEKRRGRTEERTVEKQPKGTHEHLAVCSSSSSAIYLLLVVICSHLQRGS